MRWADGFFLAVDTASEWTGKIAIYTTLLLMLVVAYEVVARYIFNSPTIWSWDVNKQIQGLMLGLGGGYVLLHGLHVRVDALVNRFTPRKQEIIDLLLSFFFFLGIGVLAWKLGEGAWRSVTSGERFSSVWAPPVYPLKVIIVVGVFLMLLQGLARFIRSLLKIFVNRGSN